MEDEEIAIPRGKRNSGLKIEGIITMKKEDREALGMTLRGLVVKHHSLVKLSAKIRHILRAMNRGYDWKEIAVAKAID